MAVRPRPGVPDSDGAEGPPRGLRAGGHGLREAEPGERGRVPPQGADAALVVAVPVRGRPVARGSADVPVRAAVAPGPALRKRVSARRPAGDVLSLIHISEPTRL